MKTKKILICIIISLTALVTLLYFGVACYFAYPFEIQNKDDGMQICLKQERTFISKTVINDIYCTGMTAKEVSLHLSKDYFAPGVIELYTREGTYSFSFDDIDLVIDYYEPVCEILRKQNPFLWINNLIIIGTYEVDPCFTYDSDKLNEVFDRLGLQTVLQGTEDVFIELTDDGYVLRNEKADILDVKSFQALVGEQIKNGMFYIKADDELYIDAKFSEKELRLIDLYDRINKVQSKKITYHFGSETKEITPYDWALLINTDELPVERINNISDSKSLLFDISDEKAKLFIDEFLDEYNTYNNRYFKGHNGDWVYVTKGNYGNKLNIKREEDWFCDALHNDIQSSNRTCEYLIEAKYKEKNDFGDTFIEISIDEQYMWYYVDGEVYVETPVTTGSYAHGGTAPRVVYVYSIIPNKWLTGPTWHNFVEYWVAIQGAIGIHDASWRKEFGGNIYKYGGSHGCVNTPHDAMKKLFERVEIGTPVIVYSIEKNGISSID